ncbi:hypothetical protein [Bosea sp. MMO-172]|uniref:hypothetical protein n=1 Tax=Bosea sp. MMO-172 TaxID=3127885 RepID=UPI00301B63AA
MPKATPPAAPPPYDPSRTYDVRLNQIVRVGVLKLLPRNEHHLTGAVLNALVQEHGQEIVDAAVARE